MSVMNEQTNKDSLIFKQINAKVDYYLAQLIERVYFYDC
jgi:hypothetical protein